MAAIFTWQTWLAVTLICGVIELFWFNTYTLCLSAAAFLTMLASIFGLVAGGWQAIVFVVLSGLFLLANEKLLRPYLMSKKEADDGQKTDKDEPKQD
jgi:membrane protein implicated in regulation of membrane protease activity